MLLTLASLTACKKDIVEPLNNQQNSSDTRNRYPKKAVQYDSLNGRYKIWLIDYNSNNLVSKIREYDSLKNGQTTTVLSTDYTYNSSGYLIYQKTTSLYLSYEDEFNYNNDRLVSHFFNRTNKLYYYYTNDSLDYIISKDTLGNLEDSLNISFSKWTNLIFIEKTYPYNTDSTKFVQLPLLIDQEPYGTDKYNFSRVSSSLEYPSYTFLSKQIELQNELTEKLLRNSPMGISKFLNPKMPYFYCSNYKTDPDGLFGKQNIDYSYLFDKQERLQNVIANHEIVYNYFSNSTPAHRVIITLYY